MNKKAEHRPGSQRDRGMSFGHGQNRLPLFFEFVQARHDALIEVFGKSRTRWACVRQMWSS
ncbi:hypothetical protein QW131_06810 [Roseibium salinum]|nr:hypothetical protein [Roseibium salinum]